MHEDKEDGERSSDGQDGNHPLPRIAGDEGKVRESVFGQPEVRRHGGEHRRAEQEHLDHPLQHAEHDEAGQQGAQNQVECEGGIHEISGKKSAGPLQCPLAALAQVVVAQAEPPKVNLLVDIQAKLQAGKGAGYARWAKVFNLKQMAQTMNYLSENNLLEYAVLEEKAAAATAHHNELSAQIKAAEKRMAEIAVLRTHIVNYAKTREVYVAYRKAGYSKKFREEHEEEILLHQAAKNAFDEMGVKKLPKVKELQTEYAKLLEEKKKTYAEYRRSREEMRELLTAKANVDRVLKMEVEQDVEKEKDHGQR